MLSASKPSSSVCASRWTSERGATLVESLFSAVMLLALTGGLIDIGMGLQRYGTISDELMHQVRILASTSCSTVEAGSGSLPEQRRASSAEPFSIKSRALEIVKRATGSESNLVKIDVLDSGFSCDQPKFSPPVTQNALPVIEVKAWVKLPCVTCFLFGGLEVPVATRVPVEDTSPQCGYPVSC